MIFIELSSDEKESVVVDFSKIVCAAITNDKDKNFRTKLYMLGNTVIQVKESWTEIEQKVQSILRLQQLSQR